MAAAADGCKIWEAKAEASTWLRYCIERIWGLRGFNDPRPIAERVR